MERRTVARPENSLIYTPADRPEDGLKINNSSTYTLTDQPDLDSDK